MRFEGKFFHRVGSGGIFTKWVGSATSWPEDDSGPAYWDTEVITLHLEMVGFDQTAPVILTYQDIDTDLWELLNERAEDELRKALRDWITDGADAAYEEQAEVLANYEREARDEEGR